MYLKFSYCNCLGLRIPNSETLPGRNRMFSLVSGDSWVDAATHIIHVLRSEKLYSGHELILVERTETGCVCTPSKLVRGYGRPCTQILYIIHTGSTHAYVCDTCLRSNPDTCVVVDGARVKQLISRS